MNLNPKYYLDIIINIFTFKTVLTDSAEHT